MKFNCDRQCNQGVSELDYALSHNLVGVEREVRLSLATSDSKDAN